MPHVARRAREQGDMPVSFLEAVDSGARAGGCASRSISSFQIDENLTMYPKFHRYSMVDLGMFAAVASSVFQETQRNGVTHFLTIG